MRHQISLFCLTVLSVMCDFSTYAIQRTTQKDINTNFMKINEKFDYLSEKVEKLEANLSTGINANDVEEIKVNIKQIMRTIDENDKKTKAIEEHFKKLLDEIIEKNDKTNVNETKNDVVNEMSSHCTSMCESKIKILVNETSSKLNESLEKMEFCLKADDKKALNECEPNPGLKGGRFVLTSTGSDYQCAYCPYTTRSGKNFENAKCDQSNKCFLRNDMAYVVFESNSTWEEAKRKCVAEGMSLAMPKDANSTEFLINQLRPIYNPNVIKQRIFFWIGLQYNENENEYQWTDGSALGEYTGGLAGFKIWTTGKCGFLFLDGGLIFWSNGYCLTLSDTYIIYPVCEKRFVVG